MAVAVDGEFLPTGQAGKGVDSLTLHQVKVAVPPLVSAGVTAKPFPFSSGILCDGPAALLTKGVCWRCGQAVSPAK